MDTDHYLCPGCSGSLAVNPVEGFRHYVCSSCGGTVIMIAALRQLARPVAQQIWTEDPADSPGTGRARCPFCSMEMQPKAVATGSAALCRPCEAIWLDKQASGSIAVEAPSTGGQPTLASESLRCPQCGAPVSDSWQEQCKYCGAGLHTPVKVVVLPEALPGEIEGGARLGGKSLASEVLGTLLFRGLR